MRLSTLIAALILLFFASPVVHAKEGRLVSFKSFDAEETQIRGELFRPNSSGPHAAIVMMHGCSGLYTKSGKMKTNSAAWVKRFVNWGYVVLAVDGFNPRGFRSMCKKSKRPLHSIDDRPFDAYGGLAWLKKQPFVKKDQIVLVGWSNGAMAALSGVRENKAEYFGEGHRFKAIAAFYPGCITLRRRVNKRFKPYAPVLVFVGLADNWTWPKPCMRMIKQAAKDGFPAQFVAYKGAYHAFDHPNLRIKTRISRNAKWKKKKERRVTIGSNPAAREAAITTLRDWIRKRIAE
ncbi:MAG: prolyl oligopeptidase family serine peptidase [Alphaproteobacteria bacterium]|nr:prolyl oligopeptidase family serine peptidase [Alphaproteobacteria bacterium]